MKSSSSKTRLLFISPKYPFKNEEARSRVIRNYLHQLATNYNYSVFLICITNEEHNPKDLPSFIDYFLGLKQPSLFNQIANALIYSITLRKYPIQCMLYFSKRNKKKISEIIHAFNPDILFTELIRTANYCITGQHYTVCDLADLFSKRYENQLQSISHIKIQGQYRFNNGLIESLLNHSGLKSCILRMEAKLVANFEKVIPHIYDLTTLVSPVEVEQLKTLSKCDKISWVPNGTNKPSDRDLPHPTACLHIAFLGVLDVPHNQEGVIHFLNEIFPMVLEEEPSAIFNIYGKCNSTQLLNKCENTKNVRLMGFVEDLEMSISTNHVFVSPLLSGTGVQTKLFEAMKCGVPIITTKIGAEGICYDGSPPFIIADDPNTFVKQLLRVYREQPLRNQLSKRGMATVANYYWDKVGKRLNNVLQTNCF